jgi:hypothetical protein
MFAFVPGNNARSKQSSTGTTVRPLLVGLTGPMGRIIATVAERAFGSKPYTVLKAPTRHGRAGWHPSMTDGDSRIRSTNRLSPQERQGQFAPSRDGCAKRLQLTQLPAVRDSSLRTQTTPGTGTTGDIGAAAPHSKVPPSGTISAEGRVSIRVAYSSHPPYLGSEWQLR